ncbi:hypothetical protein SETIT_4G237200v2 [Setaria italica]|uniref:DUF4408 domain-containing protein n=1 Tax=Setaria italica TaxID=4555 RepID=A0A368QXU1_SETIT|nr:uncharacterized protein LOC101775538 [Setaria italica]RCV22644.1 hypothetical protein SETIT_4G237200v2 [Setaria italica]
MLVEAIPALWSAVHGWFTPAVLFVVLNIVIGTIAVTSKAAAPADGAAAEGEGAASGAGAGAGGGEEPYRKLSRVPSMAFERLRSFNLNRFAAPGPEPAVAGEVDLGYEEQPPAPAVEKEEPVGEREREVEPEPEPEQEPVNEHAAAHMERSRSEAKAEAELPRLPARLHKSASDRSAFAHFEAEEVEEAVRAVEARRPATTREGARRGRRVPVAEPESSDSDSEAEAEEASATAAGGEVDAAADAFINKFHHQLKLQRIESFIRHRETVRRGQATAAGV